jgi:hypothetical protein
VDIPTSKRDKDFTQTQETLLFACLFCLDALSGVEGHKISQMPGTKINSDSRGAIGTGTNAGCQNEEQRRTYNPHERTTAPDDSTQRRMPGVVDRQNKNVKKKLKSGMLEKSRACVRGPENKKKKKWPKRSCEARRNDRF